ncbi:reverse transcriptase protein [Rutstroemia sp. NJR-2017a BBW]|nr:reverse transcriptase protein [Rutstroemia sp. NJR-2017a BBW]
MVWHTPSDKDKAKRVTARLQGIQNKCLRTIVGAYRATSISWLEVEKYIPPIDLYLNGRSKEESKIPRFRPSYKEPARIRERLRLNTRRSGRTKGQKRAEWVDSRTRDLYQRGDPKRGVHQAWYRRWMASTLPRTDWDQVKKPPDPAVLILPRQLKKAESTVLIQMRTGRIGLAHFLSTAKVPDFPTKTMRMRSGTPRKGY